MKGIIKLNLTVALVIGITDGAHAQNTIVPDGTLGNESSIVQSQTFSTVTFDAITGGATRGGNLFHSFSQFNIGEGLSAGFLVTPQIQNIFTRVTGADPSRIQGAIRTRINNNGTLEASQANLFLLNPNGFVFGPNTSLDLAGSFLVTTASRFQFPDGQEFSAINPQTAPVLTVSTPIGLQFGTTVGDIRIDRTTLGLGNPNQLLAIIGGNVSISAANVVGINQPVTIAGIGTNQQVNVTPARPFWTINYSAVQNFRNVQVLQSSIIGSVAPINDFTQKPGIQLVADSIQVLDGSLVTTLTNSNSGRAGDIEIQARSLVVRGERASGLPTGIQSSSSTSGIGQSGDMRLQVSRIELSNGGNVTTSGQVNLSRQNTTGKIDIVADNILIAGTTRSGIASGIANAPSGEGDFANLNQPGIKIKTNRLLINGGGVIQTSNFFDGNAKSIFLDVTDVLEVQGQATVPIRGNGNTFSRSNISTAKSSGVGNSGDITIRTAILKVTDGGYIQTDLANLDIPQFSLVRTTQFQGRSGNITIEARDSVLVEGDEPRPSFPETPSYLWSKISTGLSSGAIGQAGNITIQTRDLKVLRGARIDSSNSFSTGNAGDIDIIAQGNVTIAGEGNSAEAAEFRNLSKVSTITDSPQPGDAGDIRITAASLNILQGGQVESDTFGQGRAGNITIQVQGDLNLEGTAPSGTASFISSTSIDFTPEEREAFVDRLRRIGNFDPRFVLALQTTGDGGNIQIIADNLNLNGKAAITTISTGQGESGNIDIQLRDRLIANNGSITTRSNQTSGGSIQVNAQSTRLFGDSDIQSNVASGIGNGGSINLTARSILAFDDSDILAFARDGRGGDIRFNTRAFFAENYQPRTGSFEGNQLVDINASGSVSGIISLPDTSYVQNSLNPLGQNVIDPNQLIAKTCIRRDRNAQSSLYVLGTGGLPDRPGEIRATAYPTGDVRDLSPPIADKPWQKGDPIVEPQGAYQLANGEWILSQECGV